MEFFDTHLHLTNEDEEIFYNRAQKAGVKYLLITGSDIKSSFAAAKFAEKFPNSFFAAGIHPHEAEKNSASELTELLTHDKLAAIGEIGLDYYYEFSDRNTQIKIFEECLQLAVGKNLPVIVHCRDKNDSQKAYEDCFGILKNFARNGNKIDMHCFTGSPFWLGKFLSIGAYIGYGGIITFPKAENVRELLCKTPLERILLETDTPYLAPAPHRGKENHPEYLPLIAAKAAEILNLEPEFFSRKILSNSLSFINKIK